MRTAMLWAWLALVPFAMAVADDVVIQRQSGPSFLSLEVQLPGIIIDHATLREEAGRAILLLVQPINDEEEMEDETVDDGDGLPPCEGTSSTTRTLSPYRLDPSREGSIEQLRADIPGHIKGLDAGDLNGDGLDELLFLTDDQTVQWTGVTFAALTEVGTKMQGADALDGSEPALVSVDLGRLRVFDGGSGELKIRGEAELSIDAVKLQGVWNLTSYRPRFFRRRDDGTLVFLSTPEHHGKTRLQTQRIELPPQGKTELIDCWSRLPQAEEVLEQFFLSVDGQPHLLVTTRPARKLSIFGEKSLRLYSLEADRSRLGRSPVFAIESHMNLWQVAVPRMLDINRDGANDLVIGYWKGLKKNRVAIDVYLGKPGGSFVETPRTTTVDLKEADRSLLLYGRDLNGDGLPDLLLRSEERLLVFVGRPTTSGKNLLTTKPVEIPWPTSQPEEEVVVEISGNGVRTYDSESPEGRPELIDLDDDGHPELFAVYGGAGDLPGWIRIVHLDIAP